MNNNAYSMDYGFLGEGLDALKGDTMVRVSNMGRKKVAYVIPELNIERDWNPCISGRQPDQKMIPFAELYALNQLQGGRQLIFDNLLVEGNLARKALELPLDPETEYTRKDVEKILREGTEDEILDMLEFGPYYIAEWVKEASISIDSTTRRRFIGEVFNIDIDTLEGIVKWSAEDGDADRLQYGTIQGVRTSSGSDGRQRRRSSASKEEPSKNVEKTTRNRRASK